MRIPKRGELWVVGMSYSEYWARKYPTGSGALDTQTFHVDGETHVLVLEVRNMSPYSDIKCLSSDGRVGWITSLLFAKNEARYE